MLAALILLAAAALLFAVAIHRWVTANNGYFASRRMTHLRPYWLFGSTGGFFLQRQRPNEYFKWLYAQFPHKKLFGIFDFRQPMFVLRDPQLISQLLVKDFDHFENHRKFFDDINPINEVVASALVSLRGQKWRHMRATLSPAFTGRKMRSMFELVNDCCADMCAGMLLRSETAAKEGAPLVLDMKESFSRYANDVIATAAFGHRVNSFADEENAFRTLGRRLFNFTGVRMMAKFAMLQLVPRLFKALDMQLLDGEAMGYFTSLVLDTMRQRREQGIRRPDMIDLLMRMKRGGGDDDGGVGDGPVDGFATADDSATTTTNLVGGTDSKQQPEYTDNDIVAQCFMFFIAGYDTTSTVLAFLAYELAVNPDVQLQLYEECLSTQHDLRTESTADSWRPSYDRLQRMPYMDQVVCETLRMWPPTMFTDRECSKAYAYADDNDGLRFEIAAGTNVWIPIVGLHFDAQYFHDPEHFMPERFSAENRHTIEPGAYMPFGVGPRNCIASRFALMTVKAIVYHLLLAFSFEPTIKTQIPLRLACSQNAMPEHGIHLELKWRN